MRRHQSGLWAFIGVVALLVVGCGGGGSSEPEVNLSVDQTSQLIESEADLQLVDVRTQEEWDEGHIAGAIHIPVDELGGRLSELDKTKPTVTYCAAGGRSARALNLLEQEGFNTKGHLAKGIRGWMAAEKEVVTD